MHLVTTSATLLSHTTDPELLIERAGRVCYKSEGGIKPGSHVGIVTKLKDSGHTSVIEHAVATIHVVTNRAIGNEIVRHRAGCSYCLAEGSLIPGFSKSMRWRIEELYAKTKTASGRAALSALTLRSVDEHNRLVAGKIRNVMYSGEKAVVKVTTESGRVLRATKLHQVLTPAGWRRLGELTAGDSLMANGKLAVAAREWIIQKYITERLSRPEVAKLAGVSDALMGRWIRFHRIEKPLALRMNRRAGHGVPGMHNAAGRAAIAARMSGSGNHRWRGDDVGRSGAYGRARREFQPDTCSGCGTTEGVERHHLDKDPKNNAPANVRFLCAKCHKAWHLGSGVRVVFADRIVSIEAAGTVPTYDIEMEGPNHNFVADGVVVHNSQESTRYVNYTAEKFGQSIGFIPPVRKIQASPTMMARWEKAMRAAETAYFEQIAEGGKPEECRGMLPLDLKTEIVMTYNFRAWRHFLNLRWLNKTGRSHEQIMDLCACIAPMLYKIAPTVFSEFETRADG